MSALNYVTQPTRVKLPPPARLAISKVMESCTRAMSAREQTHREEVEHEGAPGVMQRILRMRRKLTVQIQEERQYLKEVEEATIAVPNDVAPTLWYRAVSDYVQLHKPRAITPTSQVVGERPKALEWVTKRVADYKKPPQEVAPSGDLLERIKVAGTDATPEDKAVFEQRIRQMKMPEMRVMCRELGVQAARTPDETIGRLLSHVTG